MKRMIAAMLTLILCFAAAGCGKNECGHEQYEEILNALDNQDYAAAKSAIDALEVPVAQAPTPTEDPDQDILEEAQYLLAKYEESIARNEEHGWFYYDYDKAKEIYDLYASMEGVENPFVKLDDKLTLITGETEDKLGNVSTNLYKPFFRYDEQGRVIVTNDSEYGYYFGHDANWTNELHLTYGEGDRVEQIQVIGSFDEIEAKITPDYDETGVIIGCDVVMNKGEFSLTFSNTNGLRTKSEYIVNEYGDTKTYTYTYDDQGRRTGWSYFVGNGRHDYNFDVTYIYNEEGHLVESIKKGRDYEGNYTEITTYETDEQGRILSSVMTTDSKYETYVRQTFVYTYEDVYVYRG